MAIINLLAATASFLDITLGNVITIALTMATVAMGWQKLSDKMESQEKRMARVEKDLDDMAARGVPVICQMHSDRLEAIELKVDKLTSMAADFNGIKTDIQRIANHIENERHLRS